MGKDALLQFRVNGEVLDAVDRTAEILGGVSRSEAARFLLYIGITFMNSEVGLGGGKIIYEAAEKFFGEKHKKPDSD